MLSALLIYVRLTNKIKKKDYIVMMILAWNDFKRRENTCLLFSNSIKYTLSYFFNHSMMVCVRFIVTNSYESPWYVRVHFRMISYFNDTPFILTKIMFPTMCIMNHFVNRHHFFF